MVDQWRGRCAFGCVICGVVFGCLVPGGWWLVWWWLADTLPPRALFIVHIISALVVLFSHLAFCFLIPIEIRRGEVAES